MPMPQNCVYMTEEQAQEFIAAARRITDEALKSKDTTWQLLIDAGIYTEDDKIKHEAKLARKQKQKRNKK